MTNCWGRSAKRLIVPKSSLQPKGEFPILPVELRANGSSEGAVSDTEDGTAPRDIAQLWPQARRWRAAVAIAVVLVAGFFLVRYLGGFAGSDRIAGVSIEENWNQTIQSLGVSPIFPPEEDLVVGDVLAVIVDDVDPDPVAQDDTVVKKAFISRSVKLAHIDVAAELDRAYKDLPVFPAIAASTGASPKLRESVARIFTDAVLQGNLPRAAFPRLRIQGVSNASGGVALNGNSASYGAGSQQVEEFELSDVRTYGLPSVAALEVFTNFCEGEGKAICSEKTARKHLERVVGDRIDRQYLHKSGEFRYALEIEIVMVYRVYLTSSIVNLRRSTASQTGGLFGGWPFAASPPPPVPAYAPPPYTPPYTPPEVKPTEVKPADAAGTAAAEQIRILSSRLAELEARLARVRSGGAINYESFFGNESSLEGKFERPVAIGYRSVRGAFTRDGTAQTAQQ